jgi:hypothetical protein
VQRVVDQPDEGRDLVRGPARVHQPLARLGRVAGRADGRHHLVDVRHRHREAAEDVRPLARLAQLEGRAPRHHLLAEVEEGGQEPRSVSVSGRRRSAPACCSRTSLHRREAPELVQHHVGRGVALELDHHAHAVAVRFVLDVGDPLDPLVPRGLAMRSIIEALFT